MNLLTSRHLNRVRRLDPHQDTDAELREPLSRRMTFDFQETPLRAASLISRIARHDDPRDHPTSGEN